MMNIHSTPGLGRVPSALLVPLLGLTLGIAILHAEEGGIRGWVLGQTADGEHLGSIPGAKIEFLDAAGKPAYTTTSNEQGYYSVGPLPSGGFDYVLKYRVSADGYRTEDEGRGVQMAADGEVHVLDFVLTQGADVPRTMGVLNGHVWRGPEESKQPVTDARIAVKQEDGGSAMILEVDDEGAYAVELPTGTYRLSAMIEGLPAMVHPAAREIESGKTVTVDFLAGNPDSPTLERTTEVYALVSVQLAESDKAGGKAPQITFESVGRGETFESKVRPMDAGELSSLGLSSQTAGLFEWYHAEAVSPLPVGSYVAKASLGEYTPDTSDEKEVTKSRSTTFDLALRPLKSGEVVTTTGEVVTEKETPGVRGWVLGQTETGEPLGIIASAKVEFLTGAGNVAASTASSEMGYYSIEPLNPGDYTYRVTADGYQPEDAGRGFTLPDDGEIHVLDFVLTKGDGKPMPMAELNGHVWIVENGEKRAATNAVVGVRGQGGSGMVTIRTGNDGSYEVALPAGTYNASATVTGFPPNVHPSLITLAGNDERTVDFMVGLGSNTQMEKAVGVYALVSVQLAESDEPGGQTPNVVFIDDTSGAGLATKIRPLNEGDLAELGLSPSSTLSGYFEWFLAEASDPLPVGMYHAAASLKGYHPDECDSKEVSKDVSTYYDLALRPIGRPKPLPVPGPVATDGVPGLRGWVLGQTEKAEFLGPVGNAKVELMMGGGVTATANSSANGYYEIQDLPPGSYTYRVTATGFEPDDVGRGFQMPGDHKVHVLDFILTQRSKTPPAPAPEPALLEGHVWWLTGDVKNPIPGATVAARLNGDGPVSMTRTDAAGRYEFLIPPGAWEVGAMIEGVGHHVHPGLVNLPAGGTERVDFEFTEEMVTPPPCETEIYVVVAVEGTTGPPPIVEFFCQVSEDEDEVVPANLEPLGPDPAQSPRIRELGLVIDELPGGEWRWFLGTPATPVHAAAWGAEGTLGGWHPDVADPVIVEEGLPVFLDLMLGRIIPEIEVVVQDKEDKPVPGMSVKIVNKTSGQKLTDGLSLTTDDQGTSSTKLSDGVASYNVMVTGQGYEAQGREVEIKEEKTTVKFRVFKEGEMRIANLPGLVVKRIEARSGKSEDVVRVPVADAKVSLQPVSGQELKEGFATATTTDAKGEFAYLDLPEGDYTVAVAAPCCEKGEETVKVVFGMEQVVIELDQCNQILESGLRLVLTDGCGSSSAAKNAAERGAGQAKREAPDDCRADYALALASLCADDLSSAGNHATASIKLPPDDRFWDRACEAWLWCAMEQRQVQLAASGIRNLVQKHLATREPNPACEETAFVVGVAVGVMMGPWKEESASVQPEALDQAVAAALKGTLRGEYERGRDFALKDFIDLRNKEREITNDMFARAKAEKDQLDDQCRTRMAQIEPELNALAPEIETIERSIQQETINCQGKLQALIVQQQQFSAQIQRYAPQLNEQTSCLNQDRQEYAAIAANDPAGAAAILEEMRMHEREILVLNRQMQSLQQQAQQLTLAITNMQNECRRRIDTMQADVTQKRQRYERLYKEWQDLDVQVRNPIDPRKLESTESKNLANQKKAFRTYRDYPLDARRQEMLAMLPCGLEEGATPPELPSSTLPTGDAPEVTAADLEDKPMADDAPPGQVTPVIPGRPVVPQLVPLDSPPATTTPGMTSASGSQPSAAGGGSMTSDEREVFEVINELRAQSGLPKLTHDPKLTACARDHSRDMQRFGFFDHESPVPGKKTPWDRAEKFGADANAENIAQNGMGPNAVIGTWMNSDGHRANIMNPEYTRVGIGNAGEYWTQMFGK